MINLILQVRKLSSDGLGHRPNVVNHGAGVQNEPTLRTLIQSLLDLPTCPLLQAEKLRSR